ncbi:MAG TPA: helix-hairpin-helix domain-containing protein [Gemmatimonadaceae bacterium]|jgi:hypothetical protein|nr:helix-hairpin-helix domain-containing protein [Gemmatimonadaceae bacterium]
MPIASDHKVLIFVGLTAVLGTGVRVVKAARNDAPANQSTLDRQILAADSAADKQREQLANARGRGGRSASRDTTRRAQDSTRSARSKSRKPPRDSTAGRGPVGALDRPGYIAGKLDLDVATAAQIDSLPGVTPTMAKRIAADRVRRGPFTTANGLRRVEGVGDNFLREIDTLVTYSGTVVFPSAKDTIIAHRTNTRAKPPVKSP